MTRGKQPGHVAIAGPPAFRPAFRISLDGQHRPPVNIEQRDPKAVPMWLRELRRDTREQVL